MLHKSCYVVCTNFLDIKRLVRLESTLSQYSTLLKLALHVLFVYVPVRPFCSDVDVACIIGIEYAHIARSSCLD